MKGRLSQLIYLDPTHHGPGNLAIFMVPWGLEGSGTVKLLHVPDGGQHMLEHSGIRSEVE